MNRVTLMGNLTADPEIRHTPAGKAVCEFTIAVNERWTTEAGEKKERAAFIGCACWGARGEAFAKWHRKGKAALVEGKLRQDEWEKDGKKQRKTYVEVTDWHFCGSGGSEAKPDATRQQTKPATPKPAPAQPDDETLPF